MLIKKYNRILLFTYLGAIILFGFYLRQKDDFFLIIALILLIFTFLYIFANLQESQSAVELLRNGQLQEYHKRNQDFSAPRGVAQKAAAAQRDLLEQLYCEGNADTKPLEVAMQQLPLKKEVHKMMHAQCVASLGMAYLIQGDITNLTSLRSKLEQAKEVKAILAENPQASFSTYFTILFLLAAITYEQEKTQEHLEQLRLLLEHSLAFPVRMCFLWYLAEQLESRDPAKAEDYIALLATYGEELFVKQYAIKKQAKGKGEDDHVVPLST